MSPRSPLSRAVVPVRVVAAALLLLPAASCATGPARIVAPGADLPERFVVWSQEEGRARPGTDRDRCRSPLVDPRDGTRLLMVRSTVESADYRVPPGRYGVGPGQLLRVECGSGRPLGVVGG